MGFQVGLNLPGSALDAYLNPRVPGLTALGDIGTGLLDSAFKQEQSCASGRCSHAEHRGRGRAGTDTSLYDVSEGGISQHDANDPENLATDSRPRLFQNDEAPGAMPQGVTSSGWGTDETMPAATGALDAAMRAPAEAEDDPYEAEINRLRGSIRSVRGVDAKTAKAISAANRSTMGRIATLTNQREVGRRADAMQRLQESWHATDDARADEQLGISQSHLDVAMSGERRAQRKEQSELDKAYSETDDFNQLAAGVDALPHDPDPAYAYPPIFAKDKPRVNGQAVVPFATRAGAEAAWKAKTGQMKQDDAQEAVADRQRTSLGARADRDATRAEIRAGIEAKKWTVQSLTTQWKQAGHAADDLAKELEYLSPRDPSYKTKSSELSNLRDQEQALADGLAHYQASQAEAGGAEPTQMGQPAPNGAAKRTTGVVEVPAPTPEPSFATDAEAQAAFAADPLSKSLAIGSPERKALAAKYKQRVRR